MFPLNKFNIFWREGSWHRYSEWVFDCNTDCSYGCKVIEAGFMTITIFNHRCPSTGKTKKELADAAF